MIEPLSAATENTLAFRLSGTLHDADYQFFVPRVEQAIEEQGSIRLLAQLDDFHGWDARALWDDIKFGVKHAQGIERIAIVGENTWEEWMATICSCFTNAEVRYFDISEVESAWEWLGEDQSPALTVSQN